MNKFDLQLFAEEDAGGAAGGGNDNAGGQPPQGGDNGGTNGGNDDGGGQQGRTTLLGGAGTDSGGQSGGDNNGDGGNPQGGAPESYDFSKIVPEGMQYDEATAKAFGDIARTAGLSQEQASNIAQYGMKYMQQGVNAALQQQDAEIAHWGDEAKQQLGADLQPTLAKAATAMNAMESKIPGLRNILNVTGAGNRVEVIRAFAAVGELMGEDGGHNGDGTGGGNRNPYPHTNWSLYE